MQVAVLKALKPSPIAFVESRSLEHPTKALTKHDGQRPVEDF